VTDATLGDFLRPILGTSPTRDAPLTFRDIRDDIVGDRERGYTLREMQEIHGGWGDPETVGFDDRDWRSTGGRRGGRGRRVVPNPERIIWTSTLWLAVDRTTDPAEINAARVELAARLDAHCAARGMAVATVRWESEATHDATATVLMRLVADLVERTDGVWGEIRAALAEDAADRLEAAEATAEVPQPPF
jgi:hypothetical protein